MKSIKLLKRLSVFSIVLLMSIPTYAQFDQLGNIMSVGKDDAVSILDAYVSPFANGMGASLSGGWYNTAKPHKLGGFDITITANLVFIPSTDKTFNPNDLGLGDPTEGINVTIDGNESPTIAGSNSAGPQITYTQDIMGTPVDFAKFDLPKGGNLAYSFMPMVQASIGLVKGIEIIGRYSPELNYGKSGKLGLWGVGVKHDVKQWIPGLKKLPVLNISLQGGYTKLSSTNDLNFQPEFYTGIATSISNFFPEYYDNQKMIMGISNTTANLLVSADLPVICVYGGVGASISKTSLKLEGNYPQAEVVSITDIRVDESTALSDPIDMDINSTDLRLNAGVRIKMAVVTIHFDYTYANYSIATVGLGLSLR